MSKFDLRKIPLSSYSILQAAVSKQVNSLKELRAELLNYFATSVVKHAASMFLKSVFDTEGSQANLAQKYLQRNLAEIIIYITPETM